MKILLIGCGRMGGAMLDGWVRDQRITQIDVVDPNTDAKDLPHVRVHKDLTSVTAIPDMAVLAVKPQGIDLVCVGLAKKLTAATPVLSIAAGITLARLAQFLGHERPLIRAMPNTPGAIGQGITGFIKNKQIEQYQIDISNVLLSTLGNVHQVTEETMIDAITAVSGSGPAYLYAFTESLEKAAKKAGIPDELAAILARQTVIGSAALMGDQKDQSPAALREAVTSPNGTTAAGLAVLNKNQTLDTLLEKTVQAAFQRSKDLAQSQ